MYQDFYQLYPVTSCLVNTLVHWVSRILLQVQGQRKKGNRFPPSMRMSKSRKQKKYILENFNEISRMKLYYIHRYLTLLNGFSSGMQSILKRNICNLYENEISRMKLSYSFSTEKTLSYLMSCMIQSKPSRPYLAAPPERIKNDQP